MKTIIEIYAFEFGFFFCRGGGGGEGEERREENYRKTLKQDWN